MPKKQENAATADVATVDVEILRDIWDEDGERLRTGSIVPIPVEEAMDKVESGLVKRHKG